MVYFEFSSGKNIGITKMPSVDLTALIEFYLTICLTVLNIDIKSTGCLSLLHSMAEMFTRLDDFYFN